ncbi:hypothetical protein HanPI659440_Chr04g0165011 [Helianthus annuus]|nr:hypothetical protein HanPI659440_Chr04g0165011 [Helianthus annuus]
MLLSIIKCRYELCKSEKLIARAYPQHGKIFQRFVSSISQSRLSFGLLLLVVVC